MVQGLRVVQIKVCQDISSITLSKHCKDNMQHIKSRVLLFIMTIIRCTHIYLLMRRCLTQPVMQKTVHIYIYITTNTWDQVMVNCGSLLRSVIINLAVITPHHQAAYISHKLASYLNTSWLTICHLFCRMS